MPAFSDAAHDAPVTLCVFIVENHLDTLKALRMYLEMIGHTVHSASTVQAGRTAIPEAQCDVLITDIGLPDGTGWDLLQVLRAEGHAPRYAAAMSGFGTNADHLHSQQAGFRRHLLKPFKVEELDVILAEASADLQAAR